MSCKIKSKTMNSLGKSITHPNQRSDVSFFLFFVPIYLFILSYYFFFMYFQKSYYFTTTLSIILPIFYHLEFCYRKKSITVLSRYFFNPFSVCICFSSFPFFDFHSFIFKFAICIPLSICFCSYYIYLWLI